MERCRADGKGGLSARSVRYVHRNIHEALEHAVRMQMVCSATWPSLVTLPKVRPYKAKVYDEQQLIELSNFNDFQLFRRPIGDRRRLDRRLRPISGAKMTKGFIA